MALTTLADQSNHLTMARWLNQTDPHDPHEEADHVIGCVRQTCGASIRLYDVSMQMP